MQKLEQDMQKLYELFAEIALLVEHQGEQVDNVMANVINTEAYVEKANEDVKKAVIYQSSARKKKICITIVCIILLIIGALIALFVVKNKDKIANAASCASTGLGCTDLLG